MEHRHPRAVRGGAAGRGELDGRHSRPVLIIGRRPEEGRVHLRRKIDDRLPTDVDADLAAHQLSHVGSRLVGRGVWPASRERQRSLEETLQACREARGAANLRDLDHFHEE